MTQIHLSETLLKQLQHHAEQTYPQECVGALMGQVQGALRKVSEVRPLENSFEPEWENTVRSQSEGYGRERRYLVSSQALFQLLKEERGTGLRVLGFYHSHPDHAALPSGTDLEWAAPWYSYLIQAVEQGNAQQLTAWQLNDTGSAFEQVELKMSDEAV